MKKFFFRLETLISVRRARESALKREFEHATQRWDQFKEKEKMLHTQINALMEEMHKKRVEGKLHLQETYSQILEHLNVSLSQVQQTVNAHSKQLEEQKGRLKQAIQERKIVEKIKEKHYNHWRQQDAQSEGALLDEIALKTPNK